MSTFQTTGARATGLATLAIFGVAVLLREKVLLRLERFAALADASSAESQEAVRWPVAGDDELDTLASALGAPVNLKVALTGFLFRK